MRIVWVLYQHTALDHLDCHTNGTYDPSWIRRCVFRWDVSAANWEMLRWTNAGKTFWRVDTWSSYDCCWTTLCSVSRWDSTEWPNTICTIVVHDANASHSCRESILIFAANRRRPYCRIRRGKIAFCAYTSGRCPDWLAIVWCWAGTVNWLAYCKYDWWPNECAHSIRSIVDGRRWMTAVKNGVLTEWHHPGVWNRRRRPDIGWWHTNISICNRHWHAYSAPDDRWIVEWHDSMQTDLWWRNHRLVSERARQLWAMWLVSRSVAPDDWSVTVQRLVRKSLYSWVCIPTGLWATPCIRPDRICNWNWEQTKNAINISGSSSNYIIVIDVMMW